MCKALQTVGINSRTEATELLGGLNEITHIQGAAHSTHSTDVRLKGNVGWGSQKVLPGRGKISIGLRKWVVGIGRQNETCEEVSREEIAKCIGVEEGGAL